jgi:Yip1 domain
MSRAFNSAIALVQNPVAFMTANRDTQPTTRDIMINYVVPLAAITFVGTLIGELLIAAIFGFGAAGFALAFVGAVVAFVLYVAAVYIVGIIIRMLAPNFKSQPSEINSLKLASYSFTPFFLASILYIIPYRSIGDLFAFLGLLYGLYILYKGLPIMVGTPQDQVLVYEIVIVVVSIVIFAVIAVIVGIFV